MGIGINAKIAETLPYTVGDGKPSYRTNPITGMLFTPAERTDAVNNTTKTYDLGYLESLLRPEEHVYDAQG